MLGVLLREGATRGMGPSIQVLEIAQEDRLRQTNDLLPYLPQFRQFFSPLPQHKSEFKFRITAISLNDLQCITQTILKVRSSSTAL